MGKYYRHFFIFYGGMHLVVGVIIAISPSIMEYVLYSPLGEGAGALMGFLSALAGLGFLGGASANSAKSKSLFIKLAIAGNVLNFLAHFTNSLRGLSPQYMLLIGFVAIGLMISFLLFLLKEVNKTPLSH